MLSESYHKMENSIIEGDTYIFEDFTGNFTVQESGKEIRGFKS